jgi:hypothetical protein
MMRAVCGMSVLCALAVVACSGDDATPVATSASSGATSGAGGTSSTVSTGGGTTVGSGTSGSSAATTGTSTTSTGDTTSTTAGGGAGGTGGSTGSSGAGGSSTTDGGAAPRKIGGGCKLDADCDVALGLHCDLALPSGMCTKSCTIDGDCGTTILTGLRAANVCIATECYRGCSAAVPCVAGRTGYACLGMEPTSYCGPERKDAGP